MENAESAQNSTKCTKNDIFWQDFRLFSCSIGATFKTSGSFSATVHATCVTPKSCRLGLILRQSSVCLSYLWNLGQLIHKMLGWEC